MMDMFKVESHVFGYLEDPELPGLLVQMTKESLREEGRTVDTVKNRLWGFLKQRFDSRYFQQYSNARGWVGGLKRNNYGLHLYVPGKINIILCCIRWEKNGLRPIKDVPRLSTMGTKEVSSPSLLSLPPELISLIFTYLSLPTLSQVSLVCHHLSRLARNPHLWVSLHLVLPLDPEKALLVLTCPRLQRVARLSLTHLEGQGEVVMRVIQHIKTYWESSLRRLDFTNINLSEVMGDELGEVFSRLEEVQMENTSLTGEQAREVFLRLAEGTKLNSLNLGDQKNLREVPIDILADVVNNLETVVLPDDGLSDDQLTVIFRGMKQRTRLKSLQLRLHQNLPYQPNTMLLLDCCDTVFRLRSRLGRVLQCTLESPVINQTCVARVEDTEVMIEFTWKEELISFMEVFNAFVRLREKRGRVRNSVS